MPGPSDNSVVLIDAQGTPRAMSPDAAAAALSSGGGWRLQTADDLRSRADEAAREETYGGTRGIVGTAATSVASGLTLGLTDAAIAAAGGKEDLKGLRRQNPTTHTAGTIAGAVVGSVAVPGSALARTPAGLAAGVGRAAAAGEATGALGRAALAARGAAAEGAIAGLGQGVSELALSDDPLSVARVASVLGSNALYGAGLGAVAGGSTSLAADGLRAASGALGRGAEKLQERAAKLATGADSSGDDLAALDRAGLRAARQAELDLIETARMGQRESLATELGAFRTSTKGQKLFLTTKGADDAELRALGKRTLKADRQLDSLLDNPKALAAKPERALAALQQQESALEEIVKRRERLVTAFAGDTSGERAAALEAIPAALERNRALQARMAEITAAPSSARLTAIQAAEDALAAPKSPSGMGQQMLQGGTYSTVASLVGGVPVIGSILGPLVAARASSAVGDVVFGQVGKAATAAAQRATAAAAKFAAGAAKTAEAGARALSSPTSSRALRAAVFAAPGAVEPAQPAAPRRAAPAASQDGELLQAYRARTRELRSQVAPDLATGQLAVRPSARASIAQRLQPVREVSPLLADRLETHAVRRLEYLARKMPKRPDTGLVPAAADRWAPSGYEMRAWARAVSAVDDPHGVLERMADTSSISPEEAEALREVHPELVEAHVRAIIDESTKQGRPLNYQQRMALTILSGVPVEPLMRPPTLAMLQATYSSEPGSEGGTQAPQPQPQFGSVKAEAATRAQERAR